MKPLRLFFAVCLLPFAFACAQFDQLSDGQKAAGKAIARVALQLAIGELNGRVKELQPFTPNLVKLLDLTFAKPLTAEETAAQIKDHIAATIPVTHRGEVLDTLRASIRSPPASSLDKSQPDFSDQLRAAL